MKNVLVVSYDSAVLEPHRGALAAAGYEVQLCASLSAALGAVGPGKAALLLLSPEIPVGDRRRIEGEAKRRNPQIKIVLFCEGEQVKDVFANAILSVEESPATLVDTAATLLAL